MPRLSDKAPRLSDKMTGSLITKLSSRRRSALSPCLRLVAALAVAAAMNPVAGQDEPQQEESHDELPPEPPVLSYEGSPLVVPLDCAYDHFSRAGIVCSDVTPCDLFIELTAVENAGDNVFLIGNIHTPAATISTILLASADGGRNWREPIPRYSGAGFDLIQFVAPAHGWIGGQEGDYDRSTKPLLLASTNGGSRWERYPISEDEDALGAVLEFFFDTQDHGLLIVDLLVSEGDPYELYETLNGGRSWNIRQIASQKPRLTNRSVADNPVQWRISENAADGVYEVNRKEQGEWLLKSKFAVGVGSCLSMDR
jgi:hypothetical protein